MDDRVDVGSHPIRGQVQRQLGRWAAVEHATIAHPHARERFPTQPVQPAARSRHPELVRARYPGRQVPAATHDEASRRDVAPDVGQLLA